MLAHRDSKLIAQLKALGSRIPTKFELLPGDTQERLRPYHCTKHNGNLAYFCYHDPDAVEFVLKFYPELASVDWENVDKKWAEETWMKPVVVLQQRGLWAAELFFHWDRPYKEIVKLPRKEFARTILRKYEEDLLMRSHFDLDLMEVWAGYRKPEITQEGNVYRIGR